MNDQKIYNTGLGSMSGSQSPVLGESLLAAAVYSAEDAIVMTSADKTEKGPIIVYVNAAFQRLTGYSADEVIGKTLRILNGTKTEVGMLSDLYAKVEKGQVFRGVAVNIRKDGKEFINEWVFQSIRDVTGEITHFWGIMKDVTEQKKLETELMEERNILEQKNAALREILELIEIEKKKIKENVSNNVEVVVLPALSRLGRTRSRHEKKYIGIIEEHLKDLTSSFGSQLSQPNLRLSPREVEIANLVKSGLSSKDIASTLSISIKTVETIRNKIRRKLGLVNRSVNLTSYFRNS